MGYLEAENNFTGTTEIQFKYKIRREIKVRRTESKIFKKNSPICTFY